MRKKEEYFNWKKPKTESEKKRDKGFFFLFLIGLLVSGIFIGGYYAVTDFLSGTPPSADNGSITILNSSWNFDTPSNYTYNSTELEIVDDHAQLLKEDGKGLLFDGNDEIIVSSPSNILIGNNTKTISMSCWINNTSITSGYIMSIKVRTPLSHSSLFTLGINNPVGEAYIVTCTSYLPMTHSYISSSGANINDNTWHHLCAVVDGVNRTLYIDGVNVSFDTIGNIAIDNNTDNFTIGGFASGYSSLFYNGSIDEASVWTKALTQSDITEIYNNGEPNDLTTHSSWNNCTGWWKLGDNDTYPSITDNKNNNDGNMINMESDDFVEGIGKGFYFINSTIISDSSLVFSSILIGFTETSLKPDETDITYHVSIDNGTTWKWWDSTVWILTNDTYMESNNASIINNNIPTLAISGGIFKFRAFLYGNTTHTPILNNITIFYIFYEE